MHKSTLIEQKLTHQIIGIAFEAQNKLGNLLQEKYYQRAIARLLTRERIKFNQEKPVNILLDGQKIGHYKVDFVIEDKVILEIKTTDIALSTYHHQILSYMNQLQVRVGLLANFRQPKLQIKRLILPNKYLFKSA
ncbi:MAG: hypothetical protein A2900_04365 [Candidatus Chisholmbacteria bacterium RIFCSPLOWO2_01_FULL_50_28]|uniref:GxxExxY protein n=1 Tax=Candidatus Chisholmbacteria bacterium RIFCSPHIGHO2_01_FULL_52_32 TaxID=1797591 RepID=A0A1G1VSH1_9BACT|nr:MAG: hypothetical protein A2786_02380 [Candidatus Chisholmbacteria bacterium RIFCSPHIGHO2_01_FULL_52_32]OGY20287.1 MAG: hypothetical protein A2900_04365 [Candidatus Chisholmbacteria bacterium RIFCSPLOWO2_01_FULL_50_28]